MKAVAGVFTSPDEANRVAQDLRALHIPEDRITLLYPGTGHGAEHIPVTPTEQRGMGQAIGGVVGGATGAAGGLALGTAISAVLPVAGPIIAVGILGAAVLGLAGAGVGMAVGERAENFTTEGLPEDELFVYEDALRKGHSVVIALVDDDSAATSVRKLMEREGAESVDAAHDKWWIGLRPATREHYTEPPDGHGDKIGAGATNMYERGFQAATDPRTCGKEYDQVVGKMENELEALKRRYPNSDVEELFRRGYEQGRAYCEKNKKLCKKSA